MSVFGSYIRSSLLLISKQVSIVRQKKGTSDVEEQLAKAHARSAELEKQVSISEVKFLLVELVNMVHNICIYIILFLEGGEP